MSQYSTPQTKNQTKNQTKKQTKPVMPTRVEKQDLVEFLRRTDNMYRKYTPYDQHADYKRESAWLQKGTLTAEEDKEYKLMKSIHSEWVQTGYYKLCSRNKKYFASLPAAEKVELKTQYQLRTLNQAAKNDLFELVYLSYVIKDEILAQQISFLTSFKIRMPVDALFSILFWVASRRYTRNTKDNNCIIHGCGHLCRIQGRCQRNHDCKFCKYVVRDAHGVDSPKNCRNRKPRWGENIYEMPEDQAEMDYFNGLTHRICNRLTVLDQMVEFCADGFCDKNFNQKYHNIRNTADMINHLRAICHIVSVTNEYNDYVNQIKKNPLPRLATVATISK